MFWLRVYSCVSFTCFALLLGIRFSGYGLCVVIWLPFGCLALGLFAGLFGLINLLRGALDLLVGVGVCLVVGLV